MGCWTKWRKIADKKFFYEDELDYDGPACYEIATGGKNGGRIQIMYCGETSNEKKRMSNYARYGSHLADVINIALRDGWCIFYRAQYKSCKKEAIKMQNSMLYKYDYPWNIQRNINS